MRAKNNSDVDLVNSLKDYGQTLEAESGVNLEYGGESNLSEIHLNSNSLYEPKYGQRLLLWLGGAAAVSAVIFLVVVFVKPFEKDQIADNPPIVTEDSLDDKIDLELNGQSYQMFDSQGEAIVADGSVAEVNAGFVDSALDEIRTKGYLEDYGYTFNVLLDQADLRIYTTLDSSHQSSAENVKNKFVPETASNLTAAIVSIESDSGAVKSLIGGTDPDDPVAVLATDSLRQPGSSMQPFVLASLFEEGYSSQDLVDTSSPCTFTTQGGQEYQASGSGGEGTVNLSRALLGSQNCAFVRLGSVIGNNKIVDVSRKMGLSSLPEVSADTLSFPLGSVGVHPIEITSGYSVLANGGVLNEPWFVERIENSKGDTLYVRTPEPVLAVSPRTAGLLAEVLEDNITRSQGIGTGKRASVDGHFVAGKTGTTQNFTDAWFTGFSSYYTTTIWVGHADRVTPIDRTQLNLEAYNDAKYGGVARPDGGTVAAPIFSEFMAEIHVGLEPRPFVVEDGNSNGDPQVLVAENESTE